MFVQANTWDEIRQYFKKELGSKFSESELKLILKVLYQKRFSASNTDFLLASDKRLSESDLLYFHFALKRLREDEPFQYIVGETEFYGLHLKIDKRALIPRPETEELVAWICETVQTGSSPSLLDLCSGSGCIAFALKSAIPDANVLAVDVSPEAIDLIHENRDFTGLSIDILEGDVLNEAAYMYFDRGVYDVVVSNPPYIPQKDKELMDANVLNHEPHLALFVEDDDPLLFYREIARNCSYNLIDGGFLFFEIHEDLAGGVVAILESLGFVNIEVRKDLQGKDRMVRAQVVSFVP